MHVRLHESGVSAIFAVEKGFFRGNYFSVINRSIVILKVEGNLAIGRPKSTSAGVTLVKRFDQRF